MMASKKKQTFSKQKQSLDIPDAGVGEEKSRKSKALPKLDDSSDDDEEMERNFALISKRSSSRTAEEEEDDGEESGDEEGDGSALAEGGEDEDDVAAEDDEGQPTTDDNMAESDSHSDPDQDIGQSEGDRRQLQTEDDVKRELSTMSFEEIMELQNKVGTKAYNKIAYGTARSKQAPEPMKRLNKHKPQEISSKNKVPYLRKVVPVKKAISRDPRFDDLSGEYKPEIFDQTYRFINDIRQREKKMVKKKLKKAKTNTKQEELKALLKRMDNQERARQRQEQQRQKELELKRKQREMVGQGHRPFYLKKSDKKKLELAEKYSELKRSGKLENFLSKKRKRNAIKDRRKLPHQHKAN